MGDTAQTPIDLRFAADVQSDHREIADVLHDITDLVTSALGIAGAGISLLVGASPRFMTSACTRLAALEQPQETGGEGPCRDAVASRLPVVVDDLTTEGERWPAYCRDADVAGVRAVLAVPIVRAAAVSGSLELFDVEARAWSAADLSIATTFAEVVGAYVGVLDELDHERRQIAQLEHALQSRIVIEQAKGIIAARRGLSVDDAFRLIRRYATDHRAALRTVAQAIVSGGLQP